MITEKQYKEFNKASARISGRMLVRGFNLVFSHYFGGRDRKVIALWKRGTEKPVISVVNSDGNVEFYEAVDHPVARLESGSYVQ